MGELVHVGSMMNRPRCPCGPLVGEINHWKCAKGPHGPLCQIFMESILMKTHYAYTYPLWASCEHMHSRIHALPWFQSTTFGGTTYLADYRVHLPIAIAAKPFYLRINLGEDPSSPYFWLFTLGPCAERELHRSQIRKMQGPFEVVCPWLFLRNGHLRSYLCMNYHSINWERQLDTFFAACFLKYWSIVNNF